MKMQWYGVSMSAPFFMHAIACWGKLTELLDHAQQRVLQALSKKSEPELATESSIYWPVGVSQNLNMMDISPNAKERHGKNPVICSDQGHKITALDSTT